MSDYEKAFGDNLGRLLNERGVSMVELASALGLAQSTISMWVNHRRVPKMKAVQAVADYFGVDWQELLESDEDKQKALEVARMADMFMQLDAHGRDLVMMVLRAELNRVTYENMSNEGW
jgi:transcriptional regulator with XRE-family HTH domain